VNNQLTKEKFPRAAIPLNFTSKFRIFFLNYYV